MAQWLLSAHNTRETFGISYPITVGFCTEVVARRQLGDFIVALAGGTDDLDLSISAMPPVQGRLYLNMDYFVRNFGVVLPFDVESFGAPKGLVLCEQRPRLKTRLLLPFRLWRIYRETARTYREVVPRYRQLLEEVYWRLRACNPDRLTEGDMHAMDRLFAPTTLDDGSVFQRAYAVVGMLNSAISTLVSQRAPELLNLLVGHDTSTALLAERMWELRRVAVKCGAETVKLLRQGETNLDTYRNIPTAAPLLEAIQHFMRMYGHRAFRYASEFEAMRLADQPELVLLTIGGLLEEDEPPSSRAEDARQMSHQALREMNPIRRSFWRLLLRLGRGLVERREENRDTLELQNAAYGLAARLFSRYHFPNQPDDYLWLYTFDEFVTFGRSHGQERINPEVTEQRRVELEWHRQQEAPPELIWHDPETQQWWPVQEAAKDRTLTAPTRLQGIGASAGSGPVEGVALVTDSAQEAAERLLEISGPVVLVTHVTDPIWSSLFRRLTAVVTEMGGAISHAAIVARENGIPAVVGVPEATHWIGDGQRVRVDGAAGTLEVID